MRIRKADREILAAVDNILSNEAEELGLSGKQLKAWASFHERVLADELKAKKRGGGLPVAEAVKVLQGVLGRRLVLPAAFPRCGQSWYVQLQNRINASGLTAEMVKRAGEEAGKQWRGRIKAESVIRQADVLLADAGIEGGEPEYQDEYNAETMDAL